MINRLLTLFIFGFLLLYHDLSVAQNVIKAETLTTDVGLNFRHVNAITQDQKGFMWFGTKQGITKYDGNTFVIFDSKKNNPNYIPYEQVSNIIYQESNNTIWFVANYRLFTLDLKSEKLKEIEGLNELKQGEVIEIALDHTDNLWLVVDNSKDYTSKIQHLIKYDGEEFRLIKSLKRKSTGFTKISVTASNKICWTTVNHGLIILNQDGQVLNQKIIDSYDWYGYTIHFGNSFFDSKNTHYYFSEKKEGVGVYDNLEFKKQLIVNERTIKHAVEDSAGGIWFVGFTELFYLNPSGEVFDYSEDIKGVLDFSNINYAYLDFSELLWLGTDNGLIKVKLQPQNFERILKINDKSWGRTFRDIFPLKDGYIGAMSESDNLIYKIDRNDLTTPIELPDSESNLKDARFFISDTLLNKAFTVTNYLLEIDFESNTIKKHNKFLAYLNETKPNPIIKLKDESFLTGYKISKLIRIDSKTMAFQPVFKSIPEKDYIIKALIQSEFDREIIWAGTVAHGLFKLNLDGTIVARYDVSTTPSLSKNQILSLCEVDHKLLIGTFGGGLSVLNLIKNTISVIDKQNGLPDNNVASILAENKDEIIAATYNGLSRINLKTGNFLNFFEQDGISHNEFNYPSYYKSNEGHYYFGGMNGITKFSFEDLTHRKTLPSLNFTQLEVFNQRKNSLYKTTRLDGNSIILSPYDINLKVDWSIPDYFNTQDYNYFTKMDGYENNWFYQGQATSIRYNQLPAGEYKLKIKGVDVNGNETKAGLEIPIIVNQIFYKTWWFIAICILGIAVIVYALFQYRLNQAIAIERLRTKISSDLHDDVGSMLTGLAMQTEILEMQTHNSIDKKRLHKITTLSRNTISHMRDLVWSIDGRRDTVADLLERMQELAEDLLLPKKIAYTIEADQLKSSTKIDLNCKRNLFLIYKEAINNIVKHSNADQVDIKIINTKGKCILNIKDNGDVKDFKVSTGMGLVNMKLRSKNINAKLDFDFDNGFGLKVCLPHSI